MIPAGWTCPGPGANTSLGLPEIEFLRRLNQALPAEVPDWFYMWTVKEGVAHRALAERPRQGRLVLPAGRETWAKEQAEILIGGLAASGYDVIGNPDELRPRPSREPGVGPAAQAPDPVLDAAVTAAAALVVNQYRKEYPGASRSRPGRPGAGWPAGWRRPSRPRPGSSGRCAT